MKNLRTKQRETWELVDDGLGHKSDMQSDTAEAQWQQMKAATSLNMKIIEFLIFSTFNISIPSASLLFYIYGLYATFDFSSTVFKNLPLLGL